MGHSGQGEWGAWAGWGHHCTTTAPPPLAMWGEWALIEWVGGRIKWSEGTTAPPLHRCTTTAPLHHDCTATPTGAKHNHQLA